MAAFLSVPARHWLLTAAALGVLGLVAIATTPHRIRCCQQLWTPSQYALHRKHTHND